MHHALSRGNPLAYFKLLLDHGADPTLTAKDGITAFAVAARMARSDALDLFEQRGFAVTLEGDDAFLAACARGDEAAARSISAGDPILAQRLQSQNSGLLVDFAGSDNIAAVRLMLDLGFDVGSQRTSPRWAQGETALHAAAGRGHLEMVSAAQSIRPTPYSQPRFSLALSESLTVCVRILLCSPAPPRSQLVD